MYRVALLELFLKSAIYRDVACGLLKVLRRYVVNYRRIIWGVIELLTTRNWSRRSYV